MKTVAALSVVLLVSVCAMRQAQASQPVASRLVLTDVRPVSFSAVWVASEPSTCTLHVFDQEGRELTEIMVISESAIHPPAEDIGVMKVRVNNLLPDTIYYLETVTTSKATADVTVYPENPIPVLTEKSAGPVNNNGLAQEIYTEHGDHADGSLMVVTVEGGSYPITAWVGGQTNPPSPWALADMSNIYSDLTHKNLQTHGGEAIIVDVIGGMRGYAELDAKAPAPSEGSPFFQLGPPIVLNSLKGDIDGDNQLGLADALLGLRILAGLAPEKGDWGTLIDKPISLRVLHSDVDRDIKIGMQEIIYILQKLAQLR
jgi:hypothetical protein